MITPGSNQTTSHIFSGYETYKTALLCHVVKSTHQSLHIHIYPATLAAVGSRLLP